MYKVTLQVSSANSMQCAGPTPSTQLDVQSLNLLNKLYGLIGYYTG